MHFIQKEPKEKRASLVQKLKSNKILRVPGAYNPLTAKVIEEIGYDAVYVSGGVMSNDLGYPDIVLTTLKDVSNSELELVSIRLKQITHRIFHEVRSGMKSLELEDMKLILRTEVKKSIDHSHHIHLGTNEFNQSSKYDSLKTISEREEKFRREVNDDLGG